MGGNEGSCCILLQSGWWEREDPTLSLCCLETVVVNNVAI